MVSRLCLVIGLFLLVAAWLPAIPQEPSASENPAAPKPLLARIQDAIARSDTSPEAFYQKSYRPEEPRYWTKIAAWMVEDSIARHYPDDHSPERILDIGCGYGTLLSFASIIYGAEGTCLDCVPFLNPQVQAAYRLKFIQRDVERDPLPESEKYDVVIMTEVLEHLNFQPVPTLKKIHAVLKDDGSFFLSTPDADAGWGRNTTHYRKLSEIPPLDPSAKWIDGHIWHYNHKELEKVLKEAGFRIQRIDHSQGPVGGHFNVWAVKR